LAPIEMTAGWFRDSLKRENLGSKHSRAVDGGGESRRD
jgi:hypothetical protein